MLRQPKRRDPEINRPEEIEEVGVCDLCGSETAWMGRNVRCEECGEGVYQKLQEAATEKGGE